MCVLRLRDRVHARAQILPPIRVSRLRRSPRGPFTTLLTSPVMPIDRDETRKTADSVSAARAQCRSVRHPRSSTACSCRLRPFVEDTGTTPQTGMTFLPPVPPATLRIRAPIRTNTPRAATLVPPLRRLLRWRQAHRHASGQTSPGGGSGVCDRRPRGWRGGSRDPITNIIADPTSPDNAALANIDGRGPLKTSCSLLRKQSSLSPCATLDRTGSWWLLTSGRAIMGMERTRSPLARLVVRIVGFSANRRSHRTY